MHNLPEEQQRWYAIKIFERDDKVMQKLGLTKETMSHIEADIELPRRSWTTTPRASSPTSATSTSRGHQALLQEALRR